MQGTTLDQAGYYLDQGVHIIGKRVLQYLGRIFSAGVLYLNDVQAGSAGPAHVDGDGFDQGTLGKVLDLLGHGGTKQKSLSLALQIKSNLIHTQIELTV